MIVGIFIWFIENVNTINCYDYKLLCVGSHQSQSPDVALSLLCVASVTRGHALSSWIESPSVAVQKNVHQNVHPCEFFKLNL